MKQQLARNLIKQIEAWERIREEVGARSLNCGYGGCTWMCRYHIHTRIVEMYHIPSTDYLYLYAGAVNGRWEA